MTPLARWVLLALLLAGAEARPGDHACVPLCRARYRSSEVTGNCDHQQRLVLQSSGGRFPTQRLLRLCLTPCNLAGSPNDRLYTLYDYSFICRDLTESLIRRRGCNCDDTTNEGTGSLEGIGDTFQDTVRDRVNPKRPKETSMRTIVADRAEIVDLANHRRTIGPRMKFAEDTSNDENSEASVEVVIASLNTDATESDTTDDSVDWELWCIAQCDNGRGGSACNCDIIP
ncbi:uncharacterized protein LOC143146731 [Ptiloglossa arizonensis]|uniref:uncharacterized protein LOC143146731 n=1 Tax=Ptiloglossa arizonensis TaxID=3350558 RepID=UPI003FA19644